MFIPNLFCVSEVSDDVHQGIAACTSFVFFSGLHIFTCGSLFFSPFGFAHCTSMLRINLYLYIFEGLFCLARANARLQLVFRRVFFFLLRFVYLFRTPLSWYFSCAGFISACFNLRYRSVRSRMRFSQYLHLMCQLVEWFGFPSILTWSTDIFRSVPVLSMSIIFLILQYRTVRHRRSQFAISDARFF